MRSQWVDRHWVFDKDGKSEICWCRLGLNHMEGEGVNDDVDT